MINQANLKKGYVNKAELMKIKLMNLTVVADLSTLDQQ
jgi:hypothetical protein